jgi:3-hydroxybutyrate dehydrogenase
MSRVALVTGGASGIGFAVATRLAADGMVVVIADKDDAGAAGDAIGAGVVVADVADREVCRSLVADTVADHGSIDVLVNNAGYQHVSPVDEFDPDTWEHMMSVMLTAPFLLTRYAFAAMRERRWGRIVNMASIHAVVASPFKAGYVSAKHGLVGLTRTTALEGGAYGITANAVCPAYVRTPLVESQITDQAAAHGLDADHVVREIMLEPAAIKRLIEPDEVAGVVSFLCSDGGASVTGATWTIDLGWTAR